MNKKEIAKIAGKHIARRVIEDACTCCYYIYEDEIHAVLKEKGIDCEIDKELAEEIMSVYYSFGIDLDEYWIYKENGRWVFDANPGLGYLPQSVYYDEMWEELCCEQDITLERAYDEVTKAANAKLAEIDAY